MSGNGLIYVAVLSAWAVYLLTRCLKTTPADTSSGSREGTLLRRRRAAEPTAAATYSMLRPVPAQDETPVVKARRVDSPAVPAPAPPRPISRATARRRRRLIRTLLLATVGLGVPTALGLLPAWPAAVPAALLLAYLYGLRVQVRRARLARARAEAPVAIPAQRARARRADPDDAAWDPWEAEATLPVPGAVADLADGWEPRPVPLPTYVTAPKAPPVIRRIDVSAGRPWAAADDDTQEIPVVPAEVEEIPAPLAVNE